MATNTTPANTRYVPFVQQPYCCGPACLQMILYKNRLPLVPQEEIGAELGLVVPLDFKNLFYNVDAREEPVVSSGFGTRIQDPSYSLEKLIKKLAWPFDLEIKLASRFTTQDELINEMRELVSVDADVLVCFQNENGTGHICVLDVIDIDSVRVMDPSSNYPKWRVISHTDIFDLVKAHGDDNYAGLWILKKK